MVEHGCRKPHPVHPALDAGRLHQVYSSCPLPSISLAVKREKSPSSHNQADIIIILSLLFIRKNITMHNNNNHNNNDNNIYSL